MEPDNIQNLSDKQLESIYNSGKDATISFIRLLLDEIKILKDEIKSLKSEIHDMKAQAAIDSHNSSKPPSSDGFKKKNKTTKNKKKNRNRKKAGGQKGHEGKTLKSVSEPDETEVHKVGDCKYCGVSLINEKAVIHDKRQVFDLQEKIKVIVTEHQAEEKVCCNCGRHNKADFPSDVVHKTQYGKHVRAIAVYLNNYQLIPYKRLNELFEDLFNIPLSPATLVNINHECDALLKDTELAIKNKIMKSDVVNFDETGCNIGGKLHWIHTACTGLYTYYFAHKKRGSEAINDIGILNDFKGTAVHDHWKSYFKYSCLHALCNAHHLRELKFMYEEYGQKWADRMTGLLLKIKEAKGKSRNCKFKPEIIDQYEREYKRMINQGLKANPPPEKPEKKKRGKLKKSKGRNLVERLDKYKKYVLAFMYDFIVPFDNNQGERDLRMQKVKQKISCLFRSMEGANSFCRIRGFISTMKKNNRNILDAIKSIFEGRALFLIQ